MSAPRSTNQEVFLERGSKEYMRASLAFLAAGIATFTILYCVQPIFPVFTNHFHISPAASSLSLSVTTMLLAISLPVAAAISDRFGRKQIMTASLFLASICCIGTALSTNFAVLLWVRSIQGIVLAGVPAVAMAYLSEEVEGGSLGFAMGLYVSGTTIGGLFGRLFVSFLTDISSWRLAISAIAALGLLISLFFWRSLPESRHFRKKRQTLRTLLPSFASPLGDKGLVCLFLIGGLLMSGFVTLYNYMGFRLLHPPYNLSQTLVGLIFIVYLAGTFSSSWMGRVADRVGRRKVLWLNTVIMAVGALVTLAHSLLVIVVGTAIFTFGFFGGHSTASSWVGRRAGGSKGQASALYLLFYYAGSSIGGSFGGVFWSWGGWDATISMILLAVGMAFVMSLVLSRIPNVTARPG